MPRASELAEAGEDQPDHLLDAEVRIEAETNLAMPDIAGRHAYAQLTTARFGAGSIEHSIGSRVSAHERPATSDRSGRRGLAELQSSLGSSTAVPAGIGPGRGDDGKCNEKKHARVGTRTD